MQPLRLHPTAPATDNDPVEALTETKATAPKRLAAVIEPLLLSAADLAQLLRVSTATIWRLRSAGKLPRPSAALGSQLVRWDFTDVKAWQKAGMPCLRDWEAMKSH